MIKDNEVENHILDWKENAKNGDFILSALGLILIDLRKLIILTTINGVKK